MQLAHFEGAARGRLDDGVAELMGIQPDSATVLSGVLSLHRTLDKCCQAMPGWGVQERSGWSTTIPLLEKISARACSVQMHAAHWGSGSLYHFCRTHMGWVGTPMGWVGGRVETATRVGR